MLTISDAVSRSRPIGRRNFLQIGGMGIPGLSALGSLGLPMLTKSASAAETALPTTGKSVIFLFQQGGPTQYETLDPKLDCPSAIATVGGDVQTTVPGLRFGSSLSRLAKHAHRLAVVHDYQTNMGHGGVSPVVSKQLGGANIGAAYSRIAGMNHRVTGLPNSMFIIPKSVDSEQKTLGERFGNFDATGSLGKAYAPFTVGGDGPLQESLNLNLSRERFEDRRSLLRSLDDAKQNFDAVAEMNGLSRMHSQAFDLIAKGGADAFDLSKEDPKTLERYDTSSYFDPSQWHYDGNKTRNNIPWYTAHTKTLGKMLLLARRLCEVGCAFITIHSEFVWDFHADANNVAVPEGKKLVIEPFDHAVSAFIEDCEERGLSDDILLVCCGEMGRTPKLNVRGGRDHWGKLAPLMLYGGGITEGQVIGKSTRDGSEPVGKPHTPDDLMATIFHTLFNFGEARLIPDLPNDLLQTLTEMERNPGVLG